MATKIDEALALVVSATEEAKKPIPNYQFARSALEKAASLGNAEAQYALGSWHLHGQHGEVNFAEAVRYLTLAADQDHPMALFDLAVCYERGVGRPKNETGAFELYLRLALAGEKTANLEVGRCWYYGVGIMENKRLAEVWFDYAEKLGLSYPSEDRDLT